MWLVDAFDRVAGRRYTSAQERRYREYASLFAPELFVPLVPSLGCPAQPPWVRAHEWGTIDSPLTLTRERRDLGDVLERALSQQRDSQGALGLASPESYLLSALVGWCKALDAAQPADRLVPCLCATSLGLTRVIADRTRDVQPWKGIVPWAETGLPAAIARLQRVRAAVDRFRAAAAEKLPRVRLGQLRARLRGEADAALVSAGTALFYAGNAREAEPHGAASELLRLCQASEGAGGNEWLAHCRPLLCSLLGGGRHTGWAGLRDSLSPGCLGPAPSPGPAPLPGPTSPPARAGEPGATAAAGEWACAETGAETDEPARLQAPPLPAGTVASPARPAQPQPGAPGLAHHLSLLAPPGPPPSPGRPRGPGAREAADALARLAAALADLGFRAERFERACGGHVAERAGGAELQAVGAALAELRAAHAAAGESSRALAAICAIFDEWAAAARREPSTLESLGALASGWLASARSAQGLQARRLWLQNREAAQFELPRAHEHLDTFCASAQLALHALHALLPETAGADADPSWRAGSALELVGPEPPVARKRPRISLAESEGHAEGEAVRVKVEAQI